MKFIHFLILSTFLLNSCTTYQANVKKHENLKYEAVRVYPEWKYQDPKGKKVILPILGLGAAAAYGYFNETTYGEDTYSGKENAAIWGLGGLIVGGMINGILFPKRNRYRSQHFDLSQSDKWMESYNKSIGGNYLIQKKELNNSLVIVPEAKVENIRAKCSALIIDLKKDIPDIDFNALQTWKGKLNGEYSILPSSEINLVSSAISQHEQKVANLGLVRKSNELSKLENGFSSIDILTSFIDQNRIIYNAANKNHQQKIDKKIVEKLNAVLDNILPQEIEKLTSLGDTETDLYRINSLYISFKTKYTKVYRYEQVKAVDKKFRDKKAHLLDLNADRIVNKINSATTVDRLNEMENQYFSNVDDSDYRVINLNNKLQKRKNKIVEQERQEEIAARKLFSAEGLRYEQVLTNIFLGNFEEIAFDREDMTFAILFNAYITNYAKYCKKYLPVNSVELTKQECATEKVTTNGWGVEVSRNCVEWRTVGTGLYASPEMYNAKLEIDRFQAGNTLRNVFDILMQKDRVGSIMGMVADEQDANNDMIALIRKNGCNSPGLMRFQENLRLFALNKQPISYKKKTVETKGAILLANDQDFEKLVDDLISDNSKKWVVNRYQYGSTSNINIISKDGQGRPTEITAKYKYEGLGGVSYGSVRVTFNDGLPECLYFFDFPNTCRTADRRIVSQYAKGDYKKY